MATTKLESTSYHITKSLSRLTEQQKEYGQQNVIDSVSVMDHILSLKFGFTCLDAFINNSDNYNLHMCIERVCYDKELELHSLSGRPINGLLIQYLDCAYSNLRRKMNNCIINPETLEYETIVGWNEHFCASYDYVLSIYNNLSLSKADVIAPLQIKKEIHDIKEKLMFLLPLVIYAATDPDVTFAKENEKHCIPLVAFIDRATCLVYSCVVDKMDEDKVLEMKCKMMDLLANFNTEEIYIKILMASEVYIATIHLPGKEFYLLYNLMKLITNNTRPDNNFCGTLSGLYVRLKLL